MDQKYIYCAKADDGIFFGSVYFVKQEERRKELVEKGYEILFMVKVEEFFRAFHFLV